MRSGREKGGHVASPDEATGVRLRRGESMSGFGQGRDLV